MVTFYQIRDTDRFFNMIDNCIGRVLLRSSDEQMVDLRRNVHIKELLSMSCCSQGIKKLVLTIEDCQDMPRVLNYLIGC